jgi:hypothetical protein
MYEFQGADGEMRDFSDLGFGRPSGTWILFSTLPSAEALGYIRSPLPGLSGLR